MAMAKNKKEEQPEQPAAPQSQENVDQADLVEVEALRQVNTTLFGHIYPGEKNRKMIDRLLAVQLEKLGEVKIIG